MVRFELSTPLRFTASSSMRSSSLQPLRFFISPSVSTCLSRTLSVYRSVRQSSSPLSEEKNDNGERKETNKAQLANDGSLGVLSTLSTTSTLSTLSKFKAEQQASDGSLADASLSDGSLSDGRWVLGRWVLKQRVLG